MMRPTLQTMGVLVCAAAVAVAAQRQRPETRMVAAARAFLATLEPAQRQKAVFPFSSEERFNWHYIPRARQGLPLKEMRLAQRKAALDLLQAGLSAQGFEKANTVRDLEKVLKQQEHGSSTRDPENYSFSIFGDPSESGTWGWRYEGHHCALNWTLVHGVHGKSIASSPQFFGANPAEVRIEVPEAPPKGTRTLAAEEDLARALVRSLNDEQKREAVLNTTAPADIITGHARQVAIQEDRGIAYAKLAPEQQSTLRKLIREYTDKQPPALARERLRKIRKAGLDGIKFAWMGGLDRGQGHYYRVQGSTFLVEYDNTQNNANHIHSVWRDFKGDFGMDLLAMHYQAFPHRVARAKR